VDNYENFLLVQCEAALRNLATSYPYDSHEEKEISLRGQPSDIANELRREVQDRLEKAGITPVASSPAEFDAFIHSESERWAKVFKENSHLKLAD